MFVSNNNTDLAMLAVQNQNILTDFVADKRSTKTKHEYTKDLRDRILHSISFNSNFCTKTFPISGHSKRSNYFQV